MKKTTARTTAVFFALIFLLLLFIVLNVCIGSVPVPLSEIPRILISPDAADSDTLSGIVWKIRLPRLFAVMLLGGALSLSGFLLQTFFNNPIAGPYVLGISSGAKLAVAAVMIVVLGRAGEMSGGVTVGSAFIGAMAAMGLVLLISQRIQRASMLIVSGVMVGYIFSAVTDFIVTFADDASIVNLHEWSQGSFSGLMWRDVRTMAAVVLLAALLTFLLSKPIGAYQLGEGYAQSMGVNVKVFRVVLVILSSFLSAAVTAFAGPVSFVGVAVPHIVRAALRTSRPILITPACFLCGASFCLFCDLIARTLFAPTELSISTVTAVFGAPIVIAVMIRRRREG